MADITLPSRRTSVKSYGMGSFLSWGPYFVIFAALYGVLEIVYLLATSIAWILSYAAVFYSQVRGTAWTYAELRRYMTIVGGVSCLANVCVGSILVHPFSISETYAFLFSSAIATCVAYPLSQRVLNR